MCWNVKKALNVSVEPRAELVQHDRQRKYAQQSADRNGHEERASLDAVIIEVCSVTGGRQLFRYRKKDFKKQIFDPIFERFYEVCI